jgi:signal transduction histidine kinase
MTSVPREPQVARWRLSIRSQLVWAAAGIVLLTVLLSVVATYFLVIVPAQSEIAANSMRLASVKAVERVHALVGDLESTVRTARDWGAAGLLSVDDPERFNQIFLPMVRERAEITGVLFARDDGREIFLFKSGEGWSTRLTDPGRHPGRQHWRRTSQTGAVVEEWRESSYDSRQRPWFTGAVELPRESDVHWTEPYIFFAAKEPGVTVSMRLTHPGTGRRHVIAFDVTLRDLSALSASLIIGAHGGIAILTGDGRMVGLPRSAEPRSDAQMGALLLKKPFEAGFAAVDAVLAQWQTPGSPRPLVVRPPDSRGPWLGWVESVELGKQRIVVAAVAPQSDFAIGGRWHAAAIGAILLVAFGLAVFLAQHGARRLARSARALADSSDRIGNLDLDRPVSIPTRTREFHDLVQSQERMRQALLAATRYLEKTVEERTQEIARQHQELQGNYARLRELETLREGLTQMIVHDLRQPLTGLSGYLDLATQPGQDPAKAGRFAERAQHNAARLLTMINNLLDVGKLEEGKYTVRRVPASPRALAEEAVATVASLNPRCSVEVEAGAAPAQIDCDPELIQRVLTNLVTNAVQFTREGSVVRVSIEDGPGSVTFSVADQGPGIPAEFRSRIFEKFGTVTAARDVRRLSTGLGLAFCKLAVEAHGGQIGVQSEEGVGSTFIFSLPTAS